MILRNIVTGNSINEIELDYLIKLKSEIPDINEDWIAENLPFEKIQELVVLNLNEKRKEYKIFKKTARKKKLKKQLVTDCKIIDLHKIETYRLPYRNLALNISFEIILQVEVHPKNKNRSIETKEISSILNTKFIIRFGKILERLIELSINSKF